MTRLILHVLNSQAERVPIGEIVYTDSINQWNFYPYSIFPLIKEDVPLDSPPDWLETVGDIAKTINNLYRRPKDGA